MPCVVDAAPCVTPGSGRVDPSTVATDPRFTTEYPPSRVPWTKKKWDQLVVPAHDRLTPMRTLALVFQVDEALVAGRIAPHVVVDRVLDCLRGGHRVPVSLHLGRQPRRSWFALRRVLLETVGYPVTSEGCESSCLGHPVPVPSPAVTHAHATPPPHAGSSVPCVVDAAPCVAPASGRLDPSTFATDPRFTTEYPPSRVPWTDEKWDELLVPAHHRLTPKRALALVFQVDSALLAGCIAPHVVVGRVLECLPGGHRLPVCQRFALAPRRSWLALRRALLETVGYPVTWQDWDKSLRNTRPKAGESFQAFEQRVRDLCDTAQRLGHPVTTVEVLLRRKWSGGFTAT